jgi:hypothetical protein
MDMMQMSEEVKYIYESPDGGKTVTRREFGSFTKEAYYGTPEFPDEEKDIIFQTNYNLDVSAIDINDGAAYAYAGDWSATDISISDPYTGKPFSLTDLNDRLETIEKRLTILVPDAKLLEQYQVLQDLYAQYKAAESLLFGPEIEDEK